MIKTQTSFRILGECPSCKQLDGIVREPYVADKVNYSRVGCESCKATWDNYYKLVDNEEKAGRKLIPTDIWRTGNRYVGLRFPRKEKIAHSGFIVTILNSALMARYNLSPCMLTEGGVQKRGARGYGLTNDFDDISLSIDYGEQNAGHALNLYARMLLQLFQYPLSLGKTQFRRGEILWLEDKPETENDALILLFATLDSMRKGFGKKVFQKVRAVKMNPFASRFVRGLTDEEIARIFVPF